MHRVWSNICKVPDEATRFALCFCDDPTTLSRLEQGFPDCLKYSRSGTEPVPASYMIELAGRKYTTSRNRDFDSRFSWYIALPDVEIPVVARFSRAEKSYVPQEITEQLRGKTFNRPPIVQWKRCMCLVTQIDVRIESVPLVIPQDWAPEYLSLAPATCFNLGA